MNTEIIMCVVGYLLVGAFGVGVVASDGDLRDRAALETMILLAALWPFWLAAAIGLHFAQKYKKPDLKSVK